MQTSVLSKHALTSRQAYPVFVLVVLETFEQCCSHSRRTDFVVSVARIGKEGKIRLDKTISYLWRDRSFSCRNSPRPSLRLFCIAGGKYDAACFSFVLPYKLREPKLNRKRKSKIVRNLINSLAGPKTELTRSMVIYCIAWRWTFVRWSIASSRCEMRGLVIFFFDSVE